MKKGRQSHTEYLKRLKESKMIYKTDENLLKQLDALDEFNKELNEEWYSRHGLNIPYYIYPNKELSIMNAITNQIVPDKECDKMILEQAEKVREDNRGSEEIKMYENTLSGLLRLGNSQFAREEADYMVIWVTGVTPEPEMIVNTRGSFEAKLKYYAEAYTEELRLKPNKDIRIAGYDFVTAQALVKIIQASDVEAEIQEIQNRHKLI